MRQFFRAFIYAFESIRSNLFHTFLSVLGIIIGVGALVSILSVIDGMEALARQQISSTSSLNSIFVETKSHKTVNNVRLKKDTVSILDFEAFNELKLSKPILSMELNNQLSVELEFIQWDQKIGAVLMPSSTINIPDSSKVIGGLYTEEDIRIKKPVILVNDAFSEVLDIEQNSLLGQQIRFEDIVFDVVGVLPDLENSPPRAMIPISLLSNDQLKSSPPRLIVNPIFTEDIEVTKSELSDWLDNKYGSVEDAFIIRTNDYRINQVLKGFLVFRIVMGLIVGISVLVGGIGVMNVLLISVTNRTAEIGIRKAVGAKPKDIAFLFVSESITISVFGSFVGVLLGTLVTMTFTPIVSNIAELPFQAVFTWTTALIISLVALMVGIIFGTYPAIKASNLDPVDAIRHE